MMTRKEAIKRFAPKSKWRIERIVHHELAQPYKPTLTLRQKAQKGGRERARLNRTQQLIAKIARERRDQ
jgi:hypothetical protein